MPDKPVDYQWFLNASVTPEFVTSLFARDLIGEIERLKAESAGLKTAATAWQEDAEKYETGFEELVAMSGLRTKFEPDPGGGPPLPEQQTIDLVGPFIQWLIDVLEEYKHCVDTLEAVKDAIGYGNEPDELESETGPGSMADHVSLIVQERSHALDAIEQLRHAVGNPSEEHVPTSELVSTAITILECMSDREGRIRLLEEAMPENEMQNTRDHDDPVDAAIAIYKRLTVEVMLKDQQCEMAKTFLRGMRNALNIPEGVDLIAEARKIQAERDAAANRAPLPPPEDTDPNSPAWQAYAWRGGPNGACGDLSKLPSELPLPPCTKPPPGWKCKRKLNHDGPCAAVPVTPPVDHTAQVRLPGDLFWDPKFDAFMRDVLANADRAVTKEAVEALRRGGTDRFREMLQDGSFWAKYLEDLEDDGKLSRRFAKGIERVKASIIDRLNRLLSPR